MTGRLQCFSLADQVHNFFPKCQPSHCSGKEQLKSSQVPTLEIQAPVNSTLHCTNTLPCLSCAGSYFTLPLCRQLTSVLYGSSMDKSVHMHFGSDSKKLPNGPGVWTEKQEVPPVRLSVKCLPPHGLMCSSIWQPMSTRF